MQGRRERERGKENSILTRAAPFMEGIKNKEQIKTDKKKCIPNYIKEAIHVVKKFGL